MLAKLTTGAFLAASNFKENFIKRDSMPVKEMTIDNEINSGSYWDLLMVSSETFRYDVHIESEYGTFDVQV